MQRKLFNNKMSRLDSWKIQENNFYCRLNCKKLSQYSKSNTINACSIELDKNISRLVWAQYQCFLYASTISRVNIEILIARWHTEIQYFIAIETRNENSLVCLDARSSWYIFLMLQLSLRNIKNWCKWCWAVWELQLVWRKSLRST